MEEKSKFTKREWIHLLITLSIIQAFVWWVAFEYAGSSSALGYVSFAGTLISIILAVLAIGYTYGESHQQKNSSVTLANQIDELVKIKEDLKIQANALNDIQILKSELKNYSEKVDNHFVATNHKLDAFTDQLSTSYTKVGPLNIENTNELDSQQIVEKLFMSKDFKLNAIALIFFVLNFEDKEYHEDAPVSEKFLESLKEFKLTDREGSTLYGFSFHLGLTLFRLELANRDRDFIDPSVIKCFNYVINKQYDSLKSFFDGKAKTLLDLAKKSDYFESD